MPIWDEFVHLFMRRGQLALIEARRAELILFRAKVISWLFAVLTPLWIPVDLFVFPLQLGGQFAVLRLGAAIVFVCMAMACRTNTSMTSAHRAMAGLLIIPAAFFIICQPLLSHYEINGQIQQSVAASYSFLPFVMVAGLSVFPITALEGTLLCVPVWIINLLVVYWGYDTLPFGTHLGAIWLLVLISVVATMAGMSQLHFMQQILSQASRDGLTGAYNRRFGEELLNIYYALAQRNQTHFSVAFVDLDDFKSVNDKFGHDHGDTVLREAARTLESHLRNTDLLIRWGGEEFLIVFPETDLSSARTPLWRIRETGLGLRPDNRKITASIGLAERVHDNCPSWASLVETADHRMYAAKQTGKNRIIMDDSYPPKVMFAL